MMTGTQSLLLGTFLAASFLSGSQQSVATQSAGGPLVRIAELEIDPAQLEAYKLALKEEIETDQLLTRIATSQINMKAA